MDNQEFWARRGWLIAWTVVFATNLILPLYLSGLVLDVRTGMILAVLGWWGAGLAICAYSYRLRAALVIGGVVVGLLQIAVALHLVAGVMAYLLWGALAGFPSGELGPHLSDFGGFVVTVITGGLLILAALVIGGCLVWLKSWANRHDTPPAVQPTA